MDSILFFHPVFNTRLEFASQELLESFPTTPSRIPMYTSLSRLFVVTVLVLLELSSIVHAALTRFSDETMANYLQNDRAGLALLNAP